MLGEEDVPRWSLSRLGEISLSTTWETIRSHRPIVQGLDDIWKAGLTNSIAIFNWRLLSNRIPVDSKLQWRRIEMASKCQCCPQRPNTESLQHHFIQGNGTVSVWREFDGWFEGSSPPLRINDTIPERLMVWPRRTHQQNKRHLSYVIPYLILWFLWSERTRSRHQQVQFKPYNVVWQVQMFIRNSMAIGCLKPKHWSGVRPTFDIPSQADARRVRPLAMAIKWNPPDRPWIKVNTDGAYNVDTGKAGGGGVLRDAEGKLLVAFATPLEAHSALEAELLALHRGLELAKGFENPIWIESDAEQAISLLNGSQWGPAHSCQAMASLVITKRQLTFRAIFIHREGNKPADLLARMGVSLENYSRFTRHTAPRLLNAMIRMDEMGIPNVWTHEEE